MDGHMASNHVINNNIQGAFVECGVYTGNLENAWISDLLRTGQIRSIYLYDTFKGSTRPGEHDYTHPDAQLFTMTNSEVLAMWTANIIDETTNGYFYAPLEQVQARLNATGYPDYLLRYVVGDVMQTLSDPDNIPNEIAILRLDTCWYESSKYELEQLYDKVVGGGIIIINDYYQWNGQRKAVDEFLQSRNIVVDIIPLGDKKTATIIKPETPLPPPEPTDPVEPPPPLDPVVPPPSDP
jgi:O-methyltransferase